LQSLELHGFFLHSEDLPELCRSLSKCTSIEQLFLSNNNLQDYGVSYLAKVLSRHNTFKLRQLTLYNNNIGDFGAQCLSDALLGSPHLETLNLQMNFVKDLGVSYFVDALRRSNFTAYPSLRKIVMSGNQCTERMKRFIKNQTPIIII